MRGQTADAFDAGMYRHHVTVDLYLIRPALQQPPSRADCLVSDKYHGVRFVGEEARQMMEYPSARSHTRSGYYDGGSFRLVQSLRAPFTLNEAEISGGKEGRAVSCRLPQVGIVLLFVAGIEARHGGAHRRIHGDG